MEKEFYLRYCHLDRVLCRIFAVTKDHNLDLRRRILLRCIANHDIVSRIPTALEVLGNNVWLAWNLGVSYHKQLKVMTIAKDTAKSGMASNLAENVRLSKELEDCKGQKGSDKEIFRDLHRAIKRRNDQIADLEQQLTDLNTQVTTKSGEVQRLRQIFNFWLQI